MEQYAPPGIAVAVVRQGKLVFTKGWGTADLARSEPLRPDHLFRIASVSKLVTGVAALKAAEEGLLDVNAGAFDILSGFLPSSGSDPRIGQISVWHLMHHTSGWTYYGYPTGPLFRSGEIAQALGAPLPLDSDELVRWVATQALAFDPGTGFAYTNIGFVVLARVIEQSTGFAYEDFAQRFVLQPAGITTARLGGTTRSQRLPGEVEYESFQDPIWTSVFDGSSPVSEPAYGGINMTGFDGSTAWVMSVVDMARLAAATDGDPTYPDILSAESFRAMTSVGTPANTTQLGVAWFLGTNLQGITQTWSHSGGMPGTSSYLVRLPSGMIVAIVSNTARGNNFFGDLADGVVEAVNGVTQWPDVDRFADYP
jgi:CubicO group peptidase (beta-lactamase class C family)